MQFTKVNDRTSFDRSRRCYLGCRPDNFLNELPSWKHQKRPVVNGELAKAICADLIKKNAVYRQMPSNFTTHGVRDGPLDRIELFWTNRIDSGLLNGGQLAQPGVSLVEQKPVTLLSALAHRPCPCC